MEQIRIALLARPMEGGMKKHVLQLLKGLNQDLFSIHLIGPTSLYREIDINNIFYHPLELQEGFRPAEKMLQLINLFNYLRNKQIHLLHCHGVHASLIGSSAAWLAKTPVIVSTFHNLIHDHPYTPWQKRIYGLGNSLVNARINQFIAVSKAVKKELTERKKIDNDKVSVIYNGLELEEYTGLTSKPPPSPAQKYLVGMIGRFVPEKGVDLFLECAALIARVESTIRFWIVGDGPQRPFLEQKVKELDLGTKVRFLGFRQDIPRILKALDVVVVPSRSEGLSIVTLEAMASAKPVVAFATGPLPELVVPEITGILVPAFNVLALAEAVLALLKNKSYAASLGHNGLTRVAERFSVKKMIGETEAVYLKALAGKVILEG